MNAVKNAWAGFAEKHPGAFSCILYFSFLPAQLLLYHLGNAHLAVPALAAPHHGAGPVLDACHGIHAQGVVDCGKDFSPGHLFTAAYDLAIVRVLQYQLVLFFLCQLLKSWDSPAHRIKVRVRF